jgi:hypothetical protein
MVDENIHFLSFLSETSTPMHVSITVFFYFLMEVFKTKSFFGGGRMCTREPNEISGM